jgi:hypothetical protein
LIFDEEIILNESTPRIYSFLCKSTKTGKKYCEVNVGFRPFDKAPSIGSQFFFRTQFCDTSKDTIFNPNPQGYGI